jgi:predicted nucleic acid-binding protein
MIIKILPETEQLLREEIQSGHFQSVDDLIVTGVRAWREQKSRCRHNPSAAALAILPSISSCWPGAQPNSGSRFRPRSVTVTSTASGYLLDTNYVSELVRILPDARAIAWIDSVAEHSLFLSVITLAEIRNGVNERSTGARRTHLDTWLTVQLPVRFAGRILPVETAITDRWDALAASGKRKGPATMGRRIPRQRPCTTT